jgi:hypothetical protein
VSPNKYSLKIAINKKCPKNLSNLEEDKYKSTTIVYYREIEAMVPLARACFQTPLRMQRSWSNDNASTPEATVESSRGMDSELGPSVEGSPQYYHR